MRSGGAGAAFWDREFEGKVHVLSEIGVEELEGEVHIAFSEMVTEAPFWVGGTEGEVHVLPEAGVGEMEGKLHAVFLETGTEPPFWVGARTCGKFLVGGGELKGRYIYSQRRG